MALSVQRRKVWLTPNCATLPCSNAAKTRNPLKFAGVPQTNETISAASGPKFTILWRHVEEILLLNKFFSIVDTCFSYEDIARQSCWLVPDGDFLWSPYVIGQTIIFLPCGFFLSSSSSFFFSSPNLSGRRLDVYHTLTHGVALVRI